MPVMGRYRETNKDPFFLVSAYCLSEGLEAYLMTFGS